MKQLKVGDIVMWAGGFGTQGYKPARVVQMDVTDYPREKYGRDATVVDWDLIDKNMVTVTLDNGHWAYSEQLQWCEQPTSEVDDERKQA